MIKPIQYVKYNTCLTLEKITKNNIKHNKNICNSLAQFSASNLLAESKELFCAFRYCAS